MEYDLLFRYNESLCLNINDRYIGELSDPVNADIIYYPEVDDIDEEEDNKHEDVKIGFISWLFYNQELARSYGLNMTDMPMLPTKKIAKALLELDYTLISKETIDEIGAATNQNIMVLNHFGIEASWRNKGIGEQALKGLIKQMKGKCGYIVLNSEPAQFEDHDSVYEIRDVELAGLEKDPEKAQWELNAFFQRCGFRKFKDHDNVFVCNIEQVVADRKLVMRPTPRPM